MRLWIAVVIGVVTSLLPLPLVVRAQSTEILAGHGVRVSAASFGAIPNDGKNDAAALRKAVEYCRQHPGVTLVLAPGIYDFRDDAAVRLMDEVMAGKMGMDPEPVIFKPYYPYVKGLDFAGASGVTVEAYGAVLLVDGWMEPISLNHCSNVTIKGLTIDYKRKPFSEGKIIHVGQGYFDAKIEARYPVNAHTPMPRAMFWDPAASRILGDAGIDRIQIIAPQTVRAFTKSSVGAEMEGKVVGFLHSFHFRPAILIERADNTRLEDVTIHAQPGMGIVGYRSDNIALVGLRIVPGPGTFISTNTDATHFVSCTGLILFKDSEFQGMSDDATNIHNYYYSIARTALPHRYTIRVDVPTHAGVLDYPDVGDTLDLVDAKSLRTVRKVRVLSIDPHPDRMLTDIKLDADIPGDAGQYYLLDVTRMPKVEIEGCRFLSHRARGVLIKTSNVLIERNLFLFNTGTAIELAAEKAWREGGPASNVTIRDNRIVDCGGGAGTIHDAAAIAIDADSESEEPIGLNKGVLIENNIVDVHGAKRCVSVRYAEDVDIRNNEFSGCAHDVVTEKSLRVRVHDNRTDGKLDTLPNHSSVL